MIKQIFKIIWAERKINIWILLELILIFCVLWFCVDYIFYKTKQLVQPTGFDTEHVYSVRLGIKEEGVPIVNSDNEQQKDSLLNFIWTIYDRIEKYPEIEALSFSTAATPFSGSFMSRTFAIDTIKDWPQVKAVTPAFFDVFKIGIEQGNRFTWDMAGDNVVVLSGDNEPLFLGRPITEIDKVNYQHEENAFKEMKVVGIANKSKRSEYDNYQKMAYIPLTKNDKNIVNYIGGLEISVRVKPEAEKEFSKRFTKNMQSQLALGPYYLISVVSFKELKENYMGWNNYTSNFKSIYSITAFILVNIFLGVIGTFWFRVQTRRSEIGLRLALGSTKKSVKAIFLQETLLLLFLASVIASVICVNISMVDILKEINIPSINREWVKVDNIQYLWDYIITFSLLAIVAALAVWYPAKKASDIQPAEVLKDE